MYLEVVIMYLVMCPVVVVMPEKRHTKPPSHVGMSTTTASDTEAKKPSKLRILDKPSYADKSRPGILKSKNSVLKQTIIFTGTRTKRVDILHVHCVGVCLS